MARPTKPLWPKTLRAMYQRNPSPELRAALWEIARLQNLLVVTDDLCRRLNRHDLGDMPALTRLVVELDQEPAVLISRRKDARAAARPSMYSSAYRGQDAPHVPLVPDKV